MKQIQIKQITNTYVSLLKSVQIKHIVILLYTGYWAVSSSFSVGWPDSEEWWQLTTPSTKVKHPLISRTTKQRMFWYHKMSIYKIMIWHKDLFSYHNSFHLLLMDFNKYVFSLIIITTTTTNKPCTSYLLQMNSFEMHCLYLVTKFVYMLLFYNIIKQWIIVSFEWELAKYYYSEWIMHMYKMCVKTVFIEKGLAHSCV